MAMFKLFTFGPPRLQHDEQPAEVNLRKALALLVYLAVSAQPHSRDALATLLWPESDGREGRARLRRTLHRLNEVLGDTILDSSADTIRLSPDANLWLDCVAFRQYVKAGLSAASQNVFAPERLAHLKSAVELYSGDFLAGFTLPDSPAFDEWQFFQRDSLRQLYGQLLEQLVQAYRSQQAWNEAIDYARRWLALDGLHEPAHRALMRLYASAGQQAAALRQYQECVRILDAELGVEPEEDTTSLFEAIRTKQFAPAVELDPMPLPEASEPAAPVLLGSLGNALSSSIPHAPVPGTMLVGRKRESAEIAALLRRDDVRLVTLTGPGGVGKTRLALAVSDAVHASFADGTVFVGLQALSNPTLVLPTIAQALEVMEQGGQRLITSMQAALQHRQMLLVLDNFEQVLAAGVQIAELLQAVPTLKVLVTSRAALRLQMEHVITVEPLAVPRPPLPSLDELSQYEAVQLFTARAKAVKADFQLTDANAAAVAEICACLDGLPLAIELAATRVRVLTPETLLQRLGNRLKVLTSGARDLPERQQTLRATIDWSYHLLEPDERTLFRRLAVFAGGWTLHAAEAICAAEHHLLDVLDEMQSLIEKSLVQQEDTSEGGPRFSMLETIREYALESLDGCGEAESVRRCHAQYFLKLAEQAEPELATTQSAVWLNRLETEHDNLRAALEWTPERDETAIALRLVAVLWRFWHIRGHLSEGRSWLERVLSTSSTLLRETEDWAKSLTGAGTLAWVQADHAAAAQYHEQALTLYRKLQDRKGTADALNNLAAQLFNQGDGVSARTLFRESLELQRELGDSVGVVNALGNLGVVALHHGDYAHAQALCEEALTLSQATNHTLTTANMFSNLALIVMQRGDRKRAAELFKQGLRLFRELGDIAGMTECLEGLALRHAKVEPERLVHTFALAERQRSNIGAPMPPYLRAVYGPYLKAAQSQMSDEAWTANWAEGWAMTLEQAVAYAMEEHLPPDMLTRTVG